MYKENLFDALSNQIGSHLRQGVNPPSKNGKSALRRSKNDRIYKLMRYYDIAVWGKCTIPKNYRR